MSIMLLRAVVRTPECLQSVVKLDYTRIVKAPRQSRCGGDEGAQVMAIDRRRFMQMAGAAGFAMNGLIGRALAIAPTGRTGSIKDVEHIVIHMQENRSFDHYFGMLNGVRGFGDPRPLRLP